MGGGSQKIWREIKPQKAQGATRCNQTKSRFSAALSTTKSRYILAQALCWQGSSYNHPKHEENARFKKPHSFRRQVQPKHQRGCTKAFIHALTSKAQQTTIRAVADGVR